MQQEGVGDAVETIEGLGVVDARRLARGIAGGEDQRSVEAGEQQVMQRAHRQHEAEQPGIGGDGLGQREWARSLEQHHWRCGAGQGMFVIGRDRGVAAHHVQIASHQRQRLVRAVLTNSQRVHRAGIRGIDHQMEAADALDREDVSSA
ncbi:hypothetical protein GALL_486940 [mine drainage metagenome]|uniref:Uncharacterized protein n=1 Tax=mine drainage metagenome TaxID=410659 RepID=A0A1J5PEB3_9ZZZZ